MSNFLKVHPFQRVYLYLLMLSLFFYSCNKHEGYVLEINLNKPYDGYLIIEYGDFVDSFKLEKNKTTYEGIVPFTLLAKIRTESSNSIYFFLENNEIGVDISLDEKSLTIDTIIGSRTENTANDLLNYFETKSLEPDYSKTLYLRLDSLLTNSPQNELCAMALEGMAQSNVFDITQLEYLFSKLDTLTQNKSKVASIRKSIKKYSIIKEGDYLKDYSFQNKKGEMISFDSFKGNVLLVDFWASWCVYCKAEIPELKNIYSKYQKHNFEIMAVSIDSKKDYWLKAIDKNNVPWVNTWAQDGRKDNQIKELYIQSIPANYLLDKNGKIIGINIQMDQLASILANLYDND